jgi:protein-S-isoprenylcysteine O-methyltransferase Ste14
MPADLQQAHHGLLKTIVIRFTALMAAMTLLVLVPAGRLDFWQFYLYCAAFIIPMGFTLAFFLKKDPEFLLRRTKLREREAQQRKIVAITSVIIIGGFVMTGLDRRFSWSSISIPAVIIADLLIIGSYLFIVRVFYENRYAARTVEVEAHQTVAATGPYRYIRHPMYAGLIVMYLCTPIALGSYWALIPFLFLPVSLVFRILNEEKVLREQLAGYTEYCATVRYRLIPRLW